jgi:hypothetical protein
MGVWLAGQGSPKWATALAAVGATILLDRSACEGEAKWWGPAVLDAPVTRPSSLKVREPDPFSVRSQVFSETGQEDGFLQGRC